MKKTMTRSEQKRLGIIDAAKQEFSKNGFAAANINTICTVAEVSKRTLYRYFTSKEVLFNATLAEIQTSTLTHQAYPFDPEKNLYQQLKEMTYREIEVTYQIYGIHLARTIVMEFFREPQLARKMHQQLHRSQAVQQWFEDAIAAKKLIAHDAQTISNVYISLFQGLLFWPQVLELSPLPEGSALEAQIEMVVTTTLKTFAHEIRAERQT